MSKKIAVMMLLLVTILLVSAIVVDAGPIDSAKNFFKKFKGGWSKVKKHLSAKQLTNIAVLTALLAASAMMIPGVKGIAEDKRMLIAVSVILAVVLATHLVPSADSFVWQKEPIIKARILGFGCETLKEDLGIAKMGWVYSDCQSNGRYKLHRTSGDTGFEKQAILKTGPNLSGLPAFIFSLIIIAILVNAFSAQLSLDNAKYLKWFLVVYFAALIERVYTRHKMTHI